MKPMISIRKMMTTKLVECSLMGNLYRVNQIQFAELEISGTILAKATQEALGIIKHTMTLIRGIWESRKQMLEEWMLREIEGVL